MFLSIMGMYEYDPTIFDSLELPTYTDPDNKMHIIDRDAVINNILLNCAELEVIYSDFDTMKLAIGVWSAAEQNTWKKMFATQMIEYNPIWNVDANIEHSNNIKSSDNRSVESDNTTTPDTSNEHYVQGFNEITWAPAEKDIYRGTVKDNRSITDNNNNERSENYKERRTGNIGVTATQDLIQKERMIADFSIINFITKSFIKRFCIMIY